ncbi:hypothetical protein [Nonomuraea sp. NPDC049646]|uniref:hypothetical protein n=1 Tax=Nonomuraea sp. NPDC049646 TaxID=3364354 RepID=UPI0037998717
MNDPIFARRRIAQLVAELATKDRELQTERTLTRCLTSMVRNYEKELGRPLAPPPQVLHSMTVRCGRMHAVAITAGAHELVVVAPPDGFDDPDEAYRNITAHYRGDDN